MAERRQERSGGDREAKAGRVSLTRDEFLQHARRYGCDQVYNTAAEHLAGGDLVRLKIGLRKIAEAHRRTRRSRPPEASTWFEGVPGISDEDLLALHAEPLTPKEIALLAGVPVRRVYRVLEAESEAPQTVNTGTELSVAV